MKHILFLILALQTSVFGVVAQTATVTGSATVNGQPETASVTITILPKSTVSIALPASTSNTLPGGTVNLAIVSNTTRMQPAGEQFTLSGPSASFANFTVTTGAGATAAGKSATCAVPTNPPPPAGTTLLNCVIAGINNSTIATGAIIANVAVQMATSAPAGNATLTLTNFTVANAFGIAMQSSITTPTALIVVSPTMAISCAPDTNSVPNAIAGQIEPGEQLSCSVSFSSAVAAATTVTLTSNDVTPPGVTVPASVIVAAASSSAPFTATGI